MVEQIEVENQLDYCEQQSVIAQNLGDFDELNRLNDEIIILQTLLNKAKEIQKY